MARFTALLTASAFASVVGCSVFGDFSGFSNGAVADAGKSESEESSRGPDGGANLVSGGDSGRTEGDGAPLPEAPFLDSFDRPNGPVGNGWLEKTNGRFSIFDQKVRVLDGNWMRHILYRPTEEDVRDVEVSAELNWTGVSPSVDCDTTLMARLGSLSNPDNAAVGYAVFIDDTLAISLARLDSNANEVKLRGAPLPSAVNTTDTYRMTLRVAGTSPVMLTAIFEKREANDTWSTLRTITDEDDSNNRIQSAGSVGMTADVHSSFRYDNFMRKKL